MPVIPLARVHHAHGAAFCPESDPMPFLVELIIFATLAAVGVAAVLIFNRLVRRRNEVHEAWSGIDVQLRRRADLIPNLVAAVRGYAAHERSIFEEVSAQRSSMMAAGDLTA